MNGISKMSRMSYYSALDGPSPKLTGLTFDRIIVDEMATIDKKITWVSASRRFSLSARTLVETRDGEHRYYPTGMNEEDMVQIQEWCVQNNCGKRTSFDTFQFKNKAQMTIFLLRWGS